MNRTSGISLILLVVFGLLVTGCSSEGRIPEVEVEGATISSFSLTDLTLDVILSVDNPYPVGIFLQSLSFDVYYSDGEDWNYLSHGEQTGVAIEPGKNIIKVPVTIKNTDLLRSIVSLATTREMPLQIRGVVIPLLPGNLAPEIPFMRTISLTR